jgi:hypothetical protein
MLGWLVIEVEKLNLLPPEDKNIKPRRYSLAIVIFMD